MAAISPVFDQPGAGFVLLNDGVKFPPIDDGWQLPKNVHTFQEAIAHKGNVGILAVNCYIGLDQDDPQAFEGIELPNTTTWETRPGRLGMWFKCNDRTPEVLARYGKKADQAQTYLYKDGKQVGEIKLERTYQVIPPSWKRLEDGQRADYKLLQEITPTEISLEWLLSELKRLGITFQKGGKKGKRKYKTITYPAKQAYADTAIKDELHILGLAHDGNRNDQLNLSAFAIGQFIPDGYISRIKAEGELLRIAKMIGLGDTEARATTASGLAAGMLSPRDIPDPIQDLPMIIMSGRQLRDVSDETLKALVKAQDGEPYVFERGGKLCRIRFDENGSCSISSLMKDEEFRGVIGRAADFFIINAKYEEVAKPPSMDVVKDILYAMSRWDGIKPLLAIVDAPVLRADGSILMERGYDEVSRLYYSTTAPIDINIPEFSQKAAREAVKWIKDEILVDFPFVDDASTANAIAALLTPCLRPTIDGCVPFYVIDKPTPGCGASLLAEVMCLIHTGRNAEMGGKSHDDEEMGKNITAILRKGPRIAVLDNMTGVFGYANFSRMLTSRTWQERLLGKHESLSLPNLTCWMGTANNVKFGGDIARRKYTSRIDPHMARPQDRTGFKHPSIKLWVIEHRSEILSKILTICASWFAAGRPASTVKPIGSFEEWTTVLSGVLEYAGVVGFLDNRTNTDLDVDDTELADFFACWYTLHQDQEVTANMIADELTNISAFGPTRAFQRSMPRDLSQALAKSGRSANPIRYFLRSYRDRIFSNGLQLSVTTPKNKHEIAKWKVTIAFSPLSDAIPQTQETLRGIGGIVSPNARKKEDCNTYNTMEEGGKLSPTSPIGAADSGGCDSIAVSKVNQSADTDTFVPHTPLAAINTPLKLPVLTPKKEATIWKEIAALMSKGEIHPTELCSEINRKNDWCLFESEVVAYLKSFGWTGGDLIKGAGWREAMIPPEDYWMNTPGVPIETRQINICSCDACGLDKPLEGGEYYSGDFARCLDCRKAGKPLQHPAICGSFVGIMKLIGMIGMKKFPHKDKVRVDDAVRYRFMFNCNIGVVVRELCEELRLLDKNVDDYLKGRGWKVEGKKGYYDILVPPEKEKQRLRLNGEETSGEATA